MVETEDRKLESWRLHMFLSCGVPREEAENLSRRRDVDYHQLVALLAAGCELDVALRIVS